MKVLFRAALAEEEELSIVSKYFEVIQSRAQIQSGDEILCRYSFLPYGDELDQDVALMGGKLVNLYAQHRYVADLGAWYSDLKDYTPKTWFDPAEVLRQDYDGRFFCKGETNSLKNLWNTHCVAQNKADLMRVYCNLRDDSLIGQQTICIRQFEPLITYATSITRQPITKEFRVFVYRGKIMGKGYYWVNHPEVIEEFKPNPNDIPESFLAEVIERVKDHIPFFVVDVAQRIDGEWRVIELNDGCMSGLSGVDADELYRNLKAEHN